MQINNFMFYNHDIETQNLINEYSIGLKGKKKKKFDKNLALTPTPGKEWNFNCELKNKTYGTAPTEKTFHVEIPVIH